jgi:TnpA family transposase
MSHISILSPSEKRSFDLPPKFTKDERNLYFSLTPELKRTVSRFNTHDTRAGFMLQLAYFRANARFFPIESFRNRDIEYVQSILKYSNIDLTKYNSTIISRHRRKILTMLNWQDYDNAAKELLVSYAHRQTTNQQKPKQIFIGLIDLCWKNKIRIPSFFELSEIVTVSFSHTEDKLLTKTKQLLSSSDRKSLEDILTPGVKVRSRSQPPITALKKINQSLRPNQIKESLQITEKFKDLFMAHLTTFKALPLNDQATEYYATWFYKADYHQLSQFSSPTKAYLHLLAFIKHQFYKRQDTLVDILLKSVTSIKHSANAKLADKEQATKEERNEALKLLNDSHKSAWSFAKSVIAIVKATKVTPSEKYYKIEELVNEFETMDETDENKLAEFDQYLSNEVRNQSYYDLLASLSNKLQRRVSGIIKTLEFDRSSSSKSILVAIDYFKACDGKIGSSAPRDFLTKTEDALIFGEENINSPLYKCLLFFHLAASVKSGDLTLVYSYRFRAIQDYLIDKTYWEKNKGKILAEAGMTKFADGEHYLESLKNVLDDKYHTVNKRYKEGLNPHLKFNLSGKPVVSTASIKLENKEFIATTLSDNGYVSVLGLLKDINKHTDFTKCFKHFSNKNSKMRPTEEILLAGIIGKGCNIGIHKLANISKGIKEHLLHNTVNWCFDLKNIQEANRRVVGTIHSLDLANNYVYKPSVIHSSSDGRKVNVSVDSLHANYSFKYFGRDKGVTMYTFIDERQSLFYSTVFSSSDREAAYVIDGLMQNNVQENRIHSTDTHGFTEQIFAATHFIDVDFAPRFKQLSSQQTYSFSAKRTYQKKGYAILPSRTINRKLILKHWDDILRFMATIKTNHTSASLLFKRLSSYAQTNPLYKALKEFGRIIKSQFILTYYDDLKLRQQIQKQLNRVELTNKFAHAVFFDNDQAFREGTKEEQEIGTACQVLLQNTIILWNYLYLSDLILKTKNREQRASIIEAIGQGSVITWRHVNLRGEYDFTRKPANDSRFDLKRIKSLKI